LTDTPPQNDGAVKLRFAQLAVGARFVFRDQQYRKASPIEALRVGTDDRQLIPRSAKVEPLAEVDAASAAASAGPLADSAIKQAVADCMHALQRRLTERYPPTDTTQAATLSLLLKSAHDDLLARLAPRHPARRGPDDAPKPQQEK